MALLPEVLVIATALVTLLLDLFWNEKRRVWLAPIAMAGLAAALGVLVAGVGRDSRLLGGQFVVDPVAWWFKVIFLVAGIVTIAISMDLLDGRTAVRMQGIGFRGEYYTLLLSAVSGMMFLISARDLVTLYVSLELATIPLFALAAWRRGHAPSGEAGLKYVIVGALSSAFVLYGLGIFYGLTGTMSLDAIGGQLRPGPALWFAAALVLTGVGFKLTIVPFHMWAADVYEGAPVPVTAYLSVASKAAGLAFMFQIFIRMAGPFLDQWAFLLALFAAVTMTLGNLVAIVQQNIKRFMAFSAISQAGYLLMGFLGPAAGGVPSAGGVPAMVFYMLVYVVSNLVVFACIVWYSNETGREEIREYRGLSRTNPLMALAMMLGLFSLAGIPPLSGFVGKFFLFKIASAAGYHWLVAVAAVNSTVSLYYYLRVVRQMYIEPPFAEARPLGLTRPMAIAAAALAVAVVLLGVIPFFYEVIHAHTAAGMVALGAAAPAVPAPLP